VAVRHPQQDTQPGSSGFRARSGTGWPGEFAVNGLVLLHHREPGSSDGIVRTSLGLVTRIASERTRETQPLRSTPDEDEPDAARLTREAPCGGLPIPLEAPVMSAITS